MARVSRSLACAGTVAAVIVACLQAESATIDPRAKKTLAAIEPLLPAAERAAEACASTLPALESASDPTIRLAADGARLRFEMIHGLRTFMTRHPDYFIYHLGPPNLQRWHEGMNYFVACARAGTDPFRGKTSGLRTVRSTMDSQLLFYRFRLPKNYDPRRRYPLDVSLHSGAGLIWRATWVDGKPADDPALANPEERIRIDPCGRGNNCYAGPGEFAVLEAIADVKKHYAVDENRVTIGGASMGGTGGYRLGGFHPDKFACAHSLTGWPNYAVPVHDGRFDPTLLIENLCNTGLCLWYEPGDLKSADNETYIEDLPRLAKRYSGHFPHLVLNDPKGGHGIIAPELQKQGREWIRKQVRNPFPKRVIYTTYNLRYDGAYWAHIDTVLDPRKPARIEAAVGDRGVQVQVENADRFHLDLVPALVGKQKEVAVTINEGDKVTAPTGGTVYLARIDGRWGIADKRYPDGLVKKHGLSGPALDVFLDGPVLAIHGTSDGKTPAAAKQLVDGIVLRLFGPGDGGGILHSGLPRKADRDVTEADVRDKHLVLIGTPRQNRIVARIADRLPMRILDDGIEVRGKAHRGPGVGLVLVYPNPLNPERYVLLLPENYGDYTAAGSHTTFKLPDYVVIRPVDGYGGKHLEVLASGSFDARWRLGPRSPEPAAPVLRLRGGQ